ncbi:MAG: UDP-N-acetylmuramate--L-alanine ligase [Actinobacteria bacterium]|nr:UDP-N-acetylmuramate--L-alanine ligase [Actinomycetota bacterium]
MLQTDALDKYKSFFLIGIGGAGMSAIAKVLKGHGHSVSGSDLKSSRYTSLLENEGIKVYIGHSAENIKNADAVIYSTAIPQSNEELVSARNQKIPVFTRGQVLSWILNRKKGIAVTGTHGKTTTTSMISLIFRGLELDPTIIIGGELNELGSNARFGKGQFIIAEACESDGTFLMYRPFVGVVTNIEEDHMDYWKDFTLLKKSFKDFLLNIKDGGFAVINGDEDMPDIKFAAEKTGCITFGISRGNVISAANINLLNYACRFDLVIKEPGSENVKIHEVKLNVPGIHNIKNSLAALAVCHGLGLDMEKAIKTLQFFTGAKRRFEKRGEKKGAVIFDDYAHHPTEVKATLDAALIEKKGRIIAVFQPHRYSRLLNLHERFSKSFDSCDILIVTDVFASDEKPLPGITGKLLIDSMVDKGFKNRLAYIPHLNDVSAYLDSIIKKDDTVLLMGAGDITRVTDELLRI